MIVDAQANRPNAVDVMAGQVNFLGRVQRHFGQPGVGVLAQVVGADRDVVNVKQQPAAGAPDQFGHEGAFAHGRVTEGQIAGWVFDQDLAAERVLGALNVGRDHVQRLLGKRDRQQIVQIDAGIAAPGQMFGHQRRLEPLDHAD